jgi:DNA polymerase-3 subunit delta'
MPFRDIQGHRRLIDLLARSIHRGTLPPSLMFAGTSTSGARSAAIAVAQALNCVNPSNADACGVCAACTRIARGVHPDVPIVEPAETGLIRVDQVRDVIDRAAYRPFEGKRRVVIIDDADALMPQAQNALLKTLEEPTSSSVFILVTSRPDVLLPTVRSRCIRLTFAQSGADDGDEEARLVAGRVLGYAAKARDAARRLEAARELLVGTGGGGAADRQQVAAHLRAMAALLRDVELVATGADAALLSNPDLKQELTHLANSYRGERGVEAFTAIDRALAALDRNAGVKSVADWVVLQL